MTETQIRKIDLAHFSMLHSLTEEQSLKDAAKIFGRGYMWITGTEGGSDPLQRVLRVAAWNAGYTFHVYKANWICIKRDLITRHSLKKGAVTVVSNDQVHGHGHDLNVAWVQFDNPRLGHVTVLCSHYATKGRPGENKAHTINVDENRTLAHKIGDMGETYGKGSSLVFYGGDQNIVDKHTDTFFGEGFTSSWDELDKYENTGHGNIDVIASFNKDGRVEAKSVRALDDKEMHMFTDHFPVEASFNVKLLPAG